MRILRIADVPDVRTGGMQRDMYGTGDVLRAQGHTVDYLFREGLPVGGPEKLRRFTVPLRIPSLVRGLARKGREYDVVEIHEPLGAVCCLLRRIAGWHPPVVAHSFGLEELRHRALIDYRRQKGLPVSPKTRWSPLSVVLQAKYAVRHADHVICKNGADVRHLRSAGVSQDRLTEAPGAITTEFLQAEPNPARDPGRILFVGTWILRKGIADLVPAATEVLSHEARAGLTIAGCGASPESVLAEFPAKIRGRVTVIPRLASNHDLIECYRDHAVFVLPSVFEGYGLVLLEASALELALVTTDACGGGEFVDDGENGLSVPVGNPHALAGALLRLVRNPSESRRFGRQARLKAQAFSWDRVAGAVLGAYERAAHGVRGLSRAP